MKIYVAGASKQLDRCKFWIRMCSEAGHEITYDWTVAVEKYGSGGHELSYMEKRQFALNDVRGVHGADVIWLLAPPAGLSTTGSWIELGYALRLLESSRRSVVISPTVSDRVIFATIDGVVEFERDDEAFAALKGRFTGYTDNGSMMRLREHFARDRVRPDSEAANEKHLAEQSDD